MTFKLISTAALVVALGASAVMADGHSKALMGAVKARQGQMQLYAHNLGVLGAMAKGDVAYDAAAAQAAADNLVAVSGLNAMTMWPQGSDSTSMEGTRAKAEIWSNFPDVGAKAGAMAEASVAMAAAAGSDLASLQAAMGPLGGACGACHKAYRSK
ncbi:cytochrome c [Cognatishimia sp. 1_MG-2023]|uniref:c-type cytochrome n=1 Tax=Cognatishimia sp. 1_MG-2023 TaxID=3062642 RepID=UPI0026E48906|nr:cytochrome c [Cognatishimia sp. 1_MG-2023]MDO6725462.1 cytochrome c [Cognatishimia sp. 1_MG-2023]